MAAVGSSRMRILGSRHHAREMAIRCHSPRDRSTPPANRRPSICSRPRSNRSAMPWPFPLECSADPLGVVHAGDMTDRHVVADPEVVPDVVLEHDAHHRRCFAAAVVMQGPAVDLNLAGIEAIQAGEKFDQGALAAAVRSTRATHSPGRMRHDRRSSVFTVDPGYVKDRFRMTIPRGLSPAGDQDVERSDASAAADRRKTHRGRSGIFDLFRDLCRSADDGFDILSGASKRSCDKEERAGRAADREKPIDHEYIRGKICHVRATGQDPGPSGPFHAQPHHRLRPAIEQAPESCLGRLARVDVRISLIVLGDAAIVIQYSICRNSSVRPVDSACSCAATCSS